MPPSTTLIALLRGVNVGGSRCKMNFLKELMLDLSPIVDVHTYLQSGNMVLNVEQSSAEGGVDIPSLEEQIGGTIMKHCGFEPSVFVMTVAEYSTVLLANHFVNEANNDMKTVHVYFFSRDHTLNLHAHAAADKLKTATEKYAYLCAQTDRHQHRSRSSILFLHTPDGFGGSLLGRKVEKIFGAPVTARNWRTATSVLALAERCSTEWGNTAAAPAAVRPGEDEGVLGSGGGGDSGKSSSSSSVAEDCCSPSPQGKRKRKKRRSDSDGEITGSYEEVTKSAKAKAIKTTK